jgi:hypothetical protein
VVRETILLKLFRLYYATSYGAKLLSPITKDLMISGLWSILILGNNGDEGYPFAYQRDVELNVGPQITSTVSIMLIPRLQSLLT